MADLANPKRYPHENASPGRLASELTSKKTRRQVWRQIYVPLGIGVLILAVMVAGFSWTGVGTTGVWSDISLVLILIPAFLLGLMFLILLIVLTYVVVRLIDLIPGPIHRLHSNIEQIRKGTRRGTDGMVKPIFIMGAAKAALETARNLLISIFQLN